VEDIAVIVNPAAGGGKSERRWKRARRLLRAQGIKTTVMTTECPGHGTSLAKDVIGQGFRTVVAVGGDGTVHEVVNGMFVEGKPVGDVRLGIIAAGTGMDFQRNLGVRTGVRSSVYSITRGEERRVDLGLASGETSRVFVNFAEVGLGTSVVLREARFGSAWPGRASFFVAAIEAAISEQNILARVTADGDELWAGSTVSVIVANGPYFGGGMRIAPPASVDDGWLDVVVLGDFSRRERITQIWKLYPGAHLRHKKVLWQRALETQVDSDGTTYLDLDGELYADRDFHFSVLPGALRVLS
jgi:YegS/Rv2252/BmrU family lipid kinase